MKLKYDYVDPKDKKYDIHNLSPVILLHGMMDSRMTWSRLAPDIANGTGRRVYFLDARNHGDSPWSDEFNFDILAEDLYEFMNSCSIPKAIIVGHSMGGKTALTLALKRPNVVEKLVVEDMLPKNFSSGGIVVQSLRLLRDSLEVIPTNSSEKEAKMAVASILTVLLPSDQLPKSIKEEEYALDKISLRKVGNQFEWKANLDLIEKALTTKDWFNQDLSGQYFGDTLFLYGDESFLKVWRDEEMIRSLFPNAELICVEGANHLIHHQHPETFLQKLLHFINSNKSQQNSKVDETEKVHLSFSVIAPPGEYQRNLPPIIFSHGMFDSKDTWTRVAPKIATFTGRKIYLIDSRNHGDSSWSNSFDIDILAKDLSKFMDDLNIPKAVLVGHSIGGRASLTLALRQPEKVEKLIVEDISPGNFSPKLCNMIEAVSSFYIGLIESMPDGLDEMTVRRRIFEAIEDVVTSGKKSNMKESERVFFMQQLPIKSDGKTFVWKININALIESFNKNCHYDQVLSSQYIQDVLFIYGTKSVFKVSSDESIKVLFPRATLLGIEGAHHIIHHYPFHDIFIKEVVNFINGDTTIKSSVISKY